MTKFVTIGYGDRAGYDEFALRHCRRPWTGAVSGEQSADDARPALQR